MSALQRQYSAAHCCGNSPTETDRQRDGQRDRERPGLAGAAADLFCGTDLSGGSTLSCGAGCSLTGSCLTLACFTVWSSADCRRPATPVYQQRLVPHSFNKSSYMFSLTLLTHWEPGVECMASLHGVGTYSSKTGECLLFYCYSYG